MYLENNSKHQYPVGAIMAWLLVILWMALIFLLSSQTGSTSGRLSHWVAAGIVGLLRIPATEAQISGFEGVIRSLAHGMIFFILAILISRAITRIGVQDIRNALWSLLISVLYAISDEWHQSLIPGRASEWTDLLIDSGGIVLAILFYQIASVVQDLKLSKKLASHRSLW